MNDHLPAALSPAYRALISDLVQALSAVEGVVAVVLGGSFAEGTQTATSDIDVGLYYREQSPFAIEDIRRVAERISTDKPVVTQFYEWGAWVNGGAWMQTRAGKVDFLYRNVDHVQRTIADAQAGKTSHDYGQQPTFGFQSVMYLAETCICLPLYDPDGVIAALKREVEPYPTALKQAMVGGNLWGAEFTLMQTRNFAGKADVYNTVGCLARALNYLTQALFGLNETYFLSDKRALSTIERFALKPSDYSARVSHILSHPGAGAAELTETVGALETLFGAVAALTDGVYQPKYVMPAPASTLSARGEQA